MGCAHVYNCECLTTISIHIFINSTITFHTHAQVVHARKVLFRKLLHGNFVAGGDEMGTLNSPTVSCKF